jgi:hypothetical protein
MVWTEITRAKYCRDGLRYVSCDAMISGEIANSCRHGTGPHSVKICITKQGNEKIWHEVLALAGPRPALRKRRRKST